MTVFGEQLVAQEALVFHDVYLGRTVSVSGIGVDDNHSLTRLQGLVCMLGTENTSSARFVVMAKGIIRAESLISGGMQSSGSDWCRARNGSRG